MMVRIFRFLAGSIALYGLVLQFWLMTEYPGSRSLTVTLMRFLSFFTVHANILIVLCLIWPAFVPRGRASELLLRPSLRTAVMCYSAVVATIYFFVLRNIGHDQGLERIADQILHYVTPGMFLVDWIVWVPKGRVRWRDLANYLIYPALYCAWTFLYGAVSGWYPYPFFNPGRLDHQEILGSIVALACLVLATALILLLLDRALAGRGGLRT